jgi:dephospho-CoA kinase
MKKVGVTGGIGSGKSTVCKIFNHLGIPVFDADSEAKNLLNTKEVYEFYITEFGDKVLSDNNLDKKKIARLIFNNPDDLKKVNAFIHPLVGKLFSKWIDNHTDAPYIIHEAALIFEAGINKNLDYTIFVSAPEELRIERVIKRDSSTREDILNRIRNQMPDKDKAAMADFLIYNDEESFLITQVLNLHEKFL